MITTVNRKRRAASQDYAERPAKAHDLTTLRELAYPASVHAVPGTNVAVSAFNQFEFACHKMGRHLPQHLLVIMPIPDTAPPILATQWFNSTEALTLEALRGKVVVIEAFQMLCEGCVSHSLPQARRIFGTFNRDGVAVIGLHCVFENHTSQTSEALEEFLREHRILFPVAADTPVGSSLPRTMASYGMQGTPTTVLVDRQGRRRAQHFGPVSDLQLGAELGTLLSERDSIHTGSPGEPLIR